MNKNYSDELGWAAQKYFTNQTVASYNYWLVSEYDAIMRKFQFFLTRSDLVCATTAQAQLRNPHIYLTFFN
jgi:hypothetical protein